MFKKAFFIAVASLLFLRCSNKLDILAPYKESVSVYGLLNQNDSVQYIRIQRVYLGEGNAITMAQNEDSCYFKPGDIKATLERYKNGAQISVDNPATTNMEIVLAEAYVQLQPGVFSTNQLIYKTNHAIYEDGSTYKLVVHSNKTGKEFTSPAIGLIGDFKSGLVYAQQGSILTNNPVTQPTPTVALVPSNGNMKCKFASPSNAAVCGLIVRFFFTETPYSGPAVQKYIDINLGVDYLENSNGGQEVDFGYNGDGMLHNIANAIPVDANINTRRADSIQFILNGGGYDVALYNQVNTSTSLSQTKPFYTNIKGGVGVFSCRKEFKLVKKIGQTSIIRLSSDPVTCPLRFVDQTGAISTSCP